jgi:two-component system, chemotaxis family, protein-glutamate methylesterase/glutaminase
MAPTKVLLVEDSPVAMELLQRLFRSTPEVEIVGTARNGQEALAMIPRLNPTDDTKNVFALLQAGVSDIFPKPMGSEFPEYEAIKSKLLSKIKMLSGMTVKHRPL